jgi:pyridoxal phosphate enzyme (YggS family)
MSKRHRAIFARNGAAMEGVIAVSLAAVRERIAAAARAADRPPESATLVAVSKTHPAASVRQALLAGHRVFGENRVQEAQAKFPELREEFPDLLLHLIGPLQTNKVRDAVAGFDVIESVDRLRLAQALAREMEHSGRRPPCLIEVNTGEELQRAGIMPADADGFILECRERLELPIIGLMCVPPLDEEPAPHFALLREIARRNDLRILSMGMSADFEKAIRFGATHVRVGTAIFGARGAEH